MVKKVLVVFGLMAAFFSAMTLAYAQGQGLGPSGARPGQGQEFWGPGKGPNVTPEQRTKLQEIRRKFDGETAQLRGSVLTKRLELRSLWTNPIADPKAILDKERELRDLQNQMKEKGIQFRLEARKILTPEQIAQFGPGFGGRHGRGSSCMPGEGGMFGPGRGGMFGPGHRMGMGQPHGMMWN